MFFLGGKREKSTDREVIVESPFCKIKGFTGINVYLNRVWVVYRVA